MSIFDTSVQDDWARDDLIAKIKTAEKKYYNESPCLHCGPGNGCDDCRGCEDSKRNYELEMMLHNAREAYKNKKGSFYPEYDEEDTYHIAKEDMFQAVNESVFNKTKESNYKDTVVIESLWCPAGTDVSWQINAIGAPCVKFNVMEDDELYCEAAIIDMSKFLTK